tara:strand:- start:410 stop:595 length:186 start_codon:yes stop_codon:yes gene_type:complete
MDEFLFCGPEPETKGFSGKYIVSFKLTPSLSNLIFSSVILSNDFKNEWDSDDKVKEQKPFS